MNQMKTQIDQFIRELDLSSSAKKALEDRHFSDQTIDAFEIGFCPAVAGYDFDLLNGRLVLPIHDAYDNWVAFAGRKVDCYSTSVKDYYQNKTSNLQGLDKFLKWKTSKWINTPYHKSQHLFNLNRAKRRIFDKQYCFLVEGYFDVMRFYEHGFKNCVALCGTSLSEKHCELIYRYCNHVVVVLDGDDPGRAATNKSVLRARQLNLFASIVELPSDFDPDDLDSETLKIIDKEITSSEEEIYIKL